MFSIAKTTESKHVISVGLDQYGYEVWVRIVDPNYHAIVGFPLREGKRILRELKAGRSVETSLKKSPNPHDEFGFIEFEWDKRRGLKASAANSAEIFTQGELQGRQTLQQEAKLNLSEPKSKEFVKNLEELLSVVEKFRDTRV